MEVDDGHAAAHFSDTPLFVLGSQVGCHRPLVCQLAFVSLLFVFLVSVSLRFLPYAGLLLPRPLSLCALLVMRKY